MLINIDQIKNEKDKTLIERVCNELNHKTIENGTPLKIVNGTSLIVEKNEKEIIITYSCRSEIARGLLLLAANNDSQTFKIEQKRKIESLGIMADCSRNGVLKVETVKKLLLYMSILGYNTLQLYTEDTYTIPEQPFFGYLRGRYTESELIEIDDYADVLGIEVVPCIQTLAHLNALKKYPAFTDIFDIDDVLLIGEEKTYEFIEQMFKTMRKCFRSKKINIGMDEAENVGLGKYLKKNGFENRFDIMLKHLNRVKDIALKYDFSPMMWSDMFFKLALGGYYSEGNVPNEIKRLVPKEVSLVYWHYYCDEEEKYSQMMRKHKTFPNNIVFAGGSIGWMGFTPFNECSIKAIDASMNAAISNQIDDYLLTAWGDNGAECPIFSLMPSIIYASCKIYSCENKNTLDNISKVLTERAYEEWFLLDLANNLGHDAEIVNPSKYMLYNDVLLGLFDTRVEKGGAEKYREYTQLLKYKSSGKFGELFSYQSSLCDVLTHKYDLGVRLRAAYRSNNTIVLQSIIDEINLLINKIENFTLIFRKVWNDTYKPHGFDVQEIRLGGLIMRLKNTSLTIGEYLNGSIDKILELEENLIDIYNPDGNMTNRIRYNSWLRTVSPNTI